MPSQQEHSDSEIFELLQTDGEKAIELLFNKYYSFICRVVYRVLPDENHVEDLAQDVFLELWRKKEKINIKTSFKAYLRRAAINKTLNFIRDRKVKWEDEEKHPEPVSKNAGVTQEIQAKELEQIIGNAIDGLPEKCRMVFSLSRFEGLSYQQIADELQISVKTVENQISKALKVLRKAVEGYR